MIELTIPDRLLFLVIYLCFMIHPSYVHCTRYFETIVYSNRRYMYSTEYNRFVEEYAVYKIYLSVCILIPEYTSLFATKA